MGDGGQAEKRLVEPTATLGSGSATWGQTPAGGARPFLTAKWHTRRVPFGRSSALRQLVSEVVEEAFGEVQQGGCRR